MQYFGLNSEGFSSICAHVQRYVWQCLVINSRTAQLKSTVFVHVIEYDTSGCSSQVTIWSTHAIMSISRDVHLNETMCDSFIAHG